MKHAIERVERPGGSHEGVGRKKSKKAQDAVLRFLKFSVSGGFEIFEVFTFNRADKAFEIFLSNGDLEYYNTIRTGPQAIIPPKALEFKSGSVPKSLPRYKVPFLLHALGV